MTLSALKVKKKRKTEKRPPLKYASKFDIFLQLVIAIGVLITIYTVFFKVEYKWHMFDAEIAKSLITEFFRFDLVENPQKIEMLKSLINTLALAFLSTLTGFVVGIPMALLAARNISNPVVASVIKSLAGLMRAIPTIVWVLIFVSGYGLSATTAVVGMFFHTLSFFIRALSEAFEEVDASTIEALQATGSNKIQIISGAIFPSTITRMISWFGMRYEQNFATAVIIGPAVGVPGTIGTLVNNASRIADIPTLGFGVLLIFLTAFIMENILNKVRQVNMIS